MFFLIPIIGSIVSSISTAAAATASTAAIASAAIATTASTATVASTAVAATAVAVGLKKIADSVEEENVAAVSSARKKSCETVARCQAKVDAEKRIYKEEKTDSLYEHVLWSDLSENDKEACLNHLSKTV